MNPTVAHAKQRAPVTFPGPVPGTTMTGRVHAVDRRKAIARIQLRPRVWVTRPLDVVHVMNEPERGVL